MRDSVMALNRRLDKLMPILTPSGVVLGFLLPHIFLPIKPLVPWLFGVLTFSGAMNLKRRDFGAAVATPFPILVFFLLAHLCMPLVALGATHLVLPADTDAQVGFVLLFSAPTAVSAFVWVTIFGGDVALGLAILLLDTFAAPLLMPITVALLTGSNVKLDGTSMALSLTLMVVIPTVLAVATNELSGGRAPKIIGPYLSPLSKLFMVTVVAANSAAVAPGVDFSNPRVVGVALCAIVFTSLGFVLGKCVGFIPGVGIKRGRTIFFYTGMRNISAAATIAIALFPEGVALPAVLGMVFQQTLAAVFGRLLLGKAEGV